MQPHLTVLLQALRHVAVGVAVLAVLMMSFRVHLHSVGAVDSGDCTASTVVWSVLGDTITDPTEPSSPDQDRENTCDCPSPTVFASDQPVFALFTAVSPLACPTHPAGAPDNVTYPPDPPPARLS